ncbi:MAG: CIA30 family protein [Pseudomonadota bacterium]
MPQVGIAGDGITLRVKGNGERYFVHMRTTDTRRPWHYFRTTFDTTSDWKDVTLPWAMFGPASPNMVQRFDPATATSIGIVAYGKDHDANLWVSEFGIFNETGG